MANGERREGLGFWAGALVGLLFSAVVLVGLVLSVPLERPAPVVGVAPSAESEPGPEAPQPAPGDAAPEPALPEPSVSEPALSEPGEAAVAVETGADDEARVGEPGGSEPPAAAETTAIPAAIPAGPLWRVNAADHDVPPEAPLVAVVLRGTARADLPALAALAELGPLSLALDAVDADAADLMARAADLGIETLAVVDGGAGPARAAADTAAEMVRAVTALPKVVGFALGGEGPRLRDPDEAGKALTEAARERALVLDLDPAEGSALVELGRASQLPVAAPALRIGAAEPAAAAFQRLRGAADMAARSGDLVVLVEVSPSTLTAVGRWLALPGEAHPAPLTAVVSRAAPTRF